MCESPRQTIRSLGSVSSITLQGFICKKNNSNDDDGQSVNLLVIHETALKSNRRLGGAKRTKAITVVTP